MCRRVFHSHAGPPNIAGQLVGGVPSSRGSAQTYQSALGLSAEEADSTNHGWRSEVCDSTWSMTTFNPSSCARATSPSKSASVPKIGSTSR